MTLVRLSGIASVLLLMQVAGFADGCAFGKGFTPQLQETHQLAVINLTESRADVAMFIAIEGIPAREELTYILPFWHQPDGFTMKEDAVTSFRQHHVSPATEQIKRMKNVATHRGSRGLLEVAPYVAAGLPTLVFSSANHLLGIRAKARQSASTSSGALTPYAVSETPHAHAELYRIGEDDLQQLIKQSGLPEQYLKPLEKYHTPYFAVMRLRGIKPAGEKAHKISGRGIRYQFTHRITDGRYTYPLGTGAAWPQPIPLTEVYITCPERLGLHVTAPVEGARLHSILFTGHANRLMRYLSEPPVQQENTKAYRDEQEIRDLLTPKTASFLEFAAKQPSAWHIAYAASNPDEDIIVKVVKQRSPWRFAIADFFTRQYVPLAASALIYLLCWVSTAKLIIRRKWKRSGRPGSLWRHYLITFIKAQFIGPLIAGSISLSLYGLLMASECRLDVATMVIVSLAVICVLSLLSAVIIYARKPTNDWRKWLTLTSWLYSSLLFAVLSAMLYGLLYWCETI